MITGTHPAHRRARFLCTLLAAAAVSFAAATPALAAGPGPGLGSGQQGALTGMVSDSVGLPLIGALIAVAVHGSEEPAAWAWTDSSGQFAVPALAPGVYTLMARRFGYISAYAPQVTVPRAEPVRMQLRSERQVVSLLSPEAPLDLGWAFRPRVRDVLRATEPDVADASHGDWLATFNEGSIWDNVGGELSLWTAASGDSPVNDSRSATQFVMGSVDGQRQNWFLQGQVAAGGVVRARSDMSRFMSESHAMRLGIGFAGKDLTIPDVDQTLRSMWVGSVSAEDYWRLTDTVQVGYGLRFEHYNYLEETGLTSPRVQVAFAPIESMTFTTGISYDAEAPGLAELRFEVDPLAVRYMDILLVDSIDPERTLRYEVGVRSDLANTVLSARAFYAEVTNELVGGWFANPSGSSDHVVANVGDSVTQGFEVDVRRPIMPSVAVAGTYAYGRRDGGPMPAHLAADRGLLTGGSYEADDVAVDIVHELAAELETVFGAYDTRLFATYRWSTGIPVIRDGSLESHYERLDVRVRQPLPFRALSSDWSALLQVQNVLGRSYDGVFDFRLGDAPVLSRLFSGGLAVRF